MEGALGPSGQGGDLEGVFDGGLDLHDWADVLTLADELPSEDAEELAHVISESILRGEVLEYFDPSHPPVDGCLRGCVSIALRDHDEPVLRLVARMIK